MAKVRVHPVPEAPRAPAARPEAPGLTVLELHGKVITVVDELTVMEDIAMGNVVKGEDASNLVLGMYASAVALVRSVDGEPVRVPSTLRELKALMTQLGDPVVKALVRRELARAEQRMAEAKEAAKN